jgi:putative effector of murein hydrolase
MNEGLPLVTATASAAAGRLADVWVYLSASPLLGLTATLLVYQAAFVAYRRSGFHPLANPVALSVPLFDQLARLKRLWWPMLGGLVVGTLAATVTAIGVGWALGATKATVASLAPKSVTAPVAMGISEQIGGLPTLTAVLVVCTGILGAASARHLFDLLRIQDPTVRGFALGTAAHGIGTARAFLVSEEMGAFAGLAMGLCALFSAVALPLVAGWLLRWV